MNKVCLSGRLTKDPEVRYTAGENPTAIARFTLAVDRRIKKENDNADFITCVSFGKTAEFVEKYFTKGMKMNAVGRITTGSFTNKDGVKVYTTDVTVEEAEFGESKGHSDDVQSNPKPTSNNVADSGFMNIPDGIDEELPFN